MKIKQIISLLLTTAILAQNIAIAHNSWGNHNKDSHNESYIEQHNSDRIDEIRDFPKERHERFDFNKANQNNNTNHRKIIDPKVEKYSMKAPEENEVRVIATYKSKDSKTSFESINYNNTPSKMRNLSEKHVALNINRNTLSNIITNDNIEFVESDYIIYKSNNETTSNSYNADVSVLIGNYYPDSFNMIKVDKYHNIGNYGDGIRIAIFDTGLNPKSTELNINGGAVFVDGCESFADDNGHGTAMAGIIGAAMDNEGLSGIAPNAELYSVKVLNSDGIGYTSGVIEGITWAIENDIDIIYFGFTSDQYSRTLEETVNYASENGIIMVAPAGNDSTQNICYPAGYENVISVGSVDKFGNISDFSNYATTVDVYAPGENIDSILYINNKPTLLSGTSVSAAHVAGISALLLNENKNNTTYDILKYLTNTQESGFVVSDYTILDSSILPKMVNLQTPEDIMAISAANAELMTSSVTTSEGIALNQIYHKTFDSLGEKHRYVVILPNYNQTVTFEILSSNVDCDIYYEDHYNGLTYKVTDQSLVLQSGFNNFYVYCEGSGSGEYEYDLLVTSTPYDNTISEIYAGYGVDETTGNFSYGFDDLKSSVAGKDFVIQRRYNSRDFTDNHFNLGWTLNFEGKAAYSRTIYINDNQDEIEITNENIISITIPDGSVLHFEKIMSDSVCVFQPRNSRAQMDCNEALTGDIVITMPDQTKYYYYPIEDPQIDGVEHHSSGCLYKIVDKFGNTTSITLEDSKITEITDISGNKYFFCYNDGDLISISDNFGRIVTYSYSENKLVQSTDSNGIKYYYTYGTDGLLTEIKNAENAIITSVTYGNYDGYRYKVNTITDNYGSTYEYGYDTINYKTTKTELPSDEDLTPKSTTTGYDIERDVTYFVDEDGRQSSTKFFYQESIEELEITPDDEPGGVVNDFYYKWKNGEVVDYTDVTGVKTHYDYLNPLYDELGLPISKTVTGALITNEYEPELLEYVEYEYDNFGNIILEKKWIDKPDTGIGTYKAIRYIYDDSGRYLLKKRNICRFLIQLAFLNLVLQT